MKSSFIQKAISFIFVASVLFTGTVNAQQPAIQYFRPYDRAGLNMYETPKVDDTKYTGMKVRIGGSFMQNWQALDHSNSAAANMYKFTNTAGKADSSNKNSLANITAGFGLAEANLNIDVQLEDGIRVNLTSYLSAKHHNETWVKGGYFQIDKLKFLNSDFINDIMNYVTIKAGHMEINYGDAHFRRSDGGQSLYNPFVENYIMDSFATEIGTEIYFQTKGVLAMVGVSNGEIKGDLDPLVSIPTETDTTMSPALYWKVGYDNKETKDLRIRATVSGYSVDRSPSNTLFGGDRTGSHYNFVMESLVYAASGAPARPSFTGQPFSGRLNPGFSDKVNTIQANLLLQMSGLEIVGMYETATGRAASESSTRKVDQIAAEGVYRFGAFGTPENMYIGVRYNTVKGDLLGKDLKGVTQTMTGVSINRIAIAAGWYMTPNVYLKGEYVTQTYNDFPTYSLYSGGKFSGPVIEAAISF